MMDKQIKCHIIKWVHVIKLFWNNYVLENALLFKERLKCSILLIDTKLNRTEV